MDYEGFKREVLTLTGIELNYYKERQMKRRIDTLIERKGIRGYDQYIIYLKRDAAGLAEFVNYLTINVSEFYRNPNLWDTLEKDIFPELISNFGSELKIWSAACSTGDEPYSLVMLLARKLPLNKIKILATDIDDQVLTKAKLGIYTPNSINSLPLEFRNKYFQKVNDREYRISEEIKACVEFKKHNLLKDPYPKGMHLIVCRNVMIYFTEEAKDDIYRKFNQSLVKDGCLFVGNSEQVIHYREFGYRLNKLFFYSKV